MNVGGTKPEVLLLRISKVPFIDTTGEAKLANIIKYFKSQGIHVILSGIQTQPKEMLKRTGLYDKIGHQNVFEHTGEAIAFALKKIKYNECLGCKHFAFKECSILSQTENVKNLVE
jgi:SulP family sulfate permease